MILLDREDVERLDLWNLPFLVRWDPNDPDEWAKGQALDFPDVMAPGPFLLVVHDEDAWAGQAFDSLSCVAQKRADPINMKKWRHLADLYAKEMGVSRQGLVLRFSSVRRQLRQRRGWVRWNAIYHWPEGGDLVWSALVHGHHPWIEVREHQGQRQARYTR